MSGRPIRLVTAAVGSALAADLAASAAQAGCYTCGYAPTPTYVAPYAQSCGSCATSYVTPRVVYVPRVVYSAPCGYSSCGTGYVSPAYRVDLGPTYTTPVAYPADDDDYVAPRSYGPTYEPRAYRPWRHYGGYPHGRYSTPHRHASPGYYRPQHSHRGPAGRYY